MLQSLLYLQVSLLQRDYCSVFPTLCSGEALLFHPDPVLLCRFCPTSISDWWGNTSESTGGQELLFHYFLHVYLFKSNSQPNSRSYHGLWCTSAADLTCSSLIYSSPQADRADTRRAVDRWAAETRRTQISSKDSESCGLLNSQPSGSEDTRTEQRILGWFALKRGFFSVPSCCSPIDVSVMWPDRWHPPPRAWSLLQQLLHHQSNFHYRSWFKLKSAHLPKLFGFFLSCKNPD